MTPLRSRVLWVLTALALVASLLWLDAHRAGPASELSICNLALTRSDAPPADVLVAGSSRTGVAVDPIAMQGMLDAAGLDDPTVERIALGRNPLRANGALIENYLANRGTPAVIIFELSFLTERTVESIDRIAPGTPADTFLYRRDVNLIDFGQIIGEFDIVGTGGFRLDTSDLLVGGSVSIAAVPEPGAFVVLGLTGMVFASRRRRTALPV